MIETMVAVFILVTGVTAALGLAVYAYSASTNIVKQIIATGLAREGLEAVKNMRDTNWLQQTTIDTSCFNYLSLDQTANCYKNWLGNSAGTTAYCLNPTSAGGCGGGSQSASFRLGFNYVTSLPPGNVVFDNATDCGSFNVSIQTCPFTVGTNPNPIIILVTENNILSATYPVNGVPTTFTQIANNGNHITMWYLLNPDPGNHNLIINTFGGTNVDVLASSYYGAAQSGQPVNMASTVTTPCGNCNPCAANLTTTNTNSYIVSAYYNASGAWFMTLPNTGFGCGIDDPNSHIRESDSGIGLVDKVTTAPGAYYTWATTKFQGCCNNNPYIIAEIKPAPATMVVPAFWNFTQDASLPAYGNYGLQYDANNSANQGIYYPPAPNGVPCANGPNMSDYCRKIIISLDFTSPYNHPTGTPPTYYDASDVGPMVKVQSQVWWVDRNCPRAPDFTLASPSCRQEMDMILTNWKDF